MKKMILLPLLVLPLLTGCNPQPQFSLDEWLTDIEEGTMTFFDMDVYDKSTKSKMPTNGYSDYQYKLAEFIKENASSKSSSLFASTSGDRIRYIMRRNMGDYYELQILVYESSIVMFAEGYRNEKDYFRTTTYYSIPKEAGKKIIEETINKWGEMQTLANESHRKVYEEMTPENFYSFIENNDAKPFIKYNGKESRDTDLTLLNAMKDFVYIELEHELPLYEEETGILTYGIEKEYTIAIGRDYFDKKPLAQLTRYYVNPAITWGIDDLSECRVTYSISEQKLTKFMEKAQAL